MIEFIRCFLWKLLGIKYYNYLQGQNKVYLKDADWVIIGKHTYNNGAFVWRWYNHSSLIIGKFCSIANNVNFICDSGYHTESQITSYPLFHNFMSKEDEIVIGNISYKAKNISESFKPNKNSIIVGNDVWIGMNVTILPGVKIGNGVTILAGAVISADVADYSVVGGVPGKVLSVKHNQEIISAMSKISWWDWSDEKIKVNINEFYLPIEKFINKHN